MKKQIHLPGGRIYDGRMELPQATELKMPDGRVLMKVWEGDLTGEAKRQDPELESEPEQWGQVWHTRKKGFQVLASADQTPHGRLLHVSVSYPKSDPTWLEILSVKILFFGEDLDTMMVIPKNRDYVNRHPHVFHIWQTPVEWGIR